MQVFSIDHSPGNWLVSLFAGFSCAVVCASQAGHPLVDGAQVRDSVPYRVPVKEVQRRCDAVCQSCGGHVCADIGCW